MKFCRFRTSDSDVPCLGWLDDQQIIHNLGPLGIQHIRQLFSEELRNAIPSRCAEQKTPSYPLSDIKLLAPVDTQEVWAAGVTYLRSKTARMEESDFSATAYDRVYEAPRPEIFFKSLPSKVVASGDPVGIRKDATWNVPEPELGIVLDAGGNLVGYTIGNDMSSRDIEGENLLYLPQAKMYDRSCSLGPWLVLGPSEDEARSWTIGVRIERQGVTVFEGETGINQIKRRFEELSGYLFRSQTFENGAVLLTGTGVVPDDSFTLEEGDRVRIQVSGIGELENPVIRV